MMNLVRTSTTPEGVKQEFAYDTYGNSTESKTVNGTTAAIGAQTEYDETGNYALKNYDARGKEVVRSINPDDYTLTSVTDPDGQTVSNTYDDAKRVTGVETTVGTGDEAVTYRNAYSVERRSSPLSSTTRISSSPISTCTSTSRAPNVPK